jgi:nucleoside-diphosphate-sugar epimerase
VSGRSTNELPLTHLEKIDKPSENLKLFKADLLDYSSLRSAIEGCQGIFHAATLVPSTAAPNHV